MLSSPSLNIIAQNTRKEAETAGISPSSDTPYPVISFPTNQIKATIVPKAPKVAKAL